METIPVVDISTVSLRYDDCDVDDATLREVGDQLVKAFSTIGFVYLSNTGVSASQVDDVNATAMEFFQKPQMDKIRYITLDGKYGWAPVGYERLDPDKPGDLKEIYDINETAVREKRLPVEVRRFEAVMISFFHTCTRLGLRLLRALALSLRLQDPDLFIRCHTMMSPANCSCMRLLKYPPLPEDVRPGQVRLGEHTDYGSLTLLFQDMVGGLQVRNRSNQWVDAVPIKDTVLINIGDLLQRWTSDQLISTGHRVLIPDDVTLRQTVRQSIAFFMHPDDDVIVTCLDGSNKYEPITAGEYLVYKVGSTYNIS